MGKLFAGKANIDITIYPLFGNWPLSIYKDAEDIDDYDFAVNEVPPGSYRTPAPAFNVF